MRNEIIIILKNGLVQGVSVNGEDTHVEIYDYDTEGVPDEELSTDEEGNQYLKYIC